MVEEIDEVGDLSPRWCFGLHVFQNYLDTLLIVLFKIFFLKQDHNYIILLTKTTAAQNEVALSYHKVRGLYFLAVVSVRSILGSTIAWMATVS